MSAWPLARLQVELVNVCNFRCPLCRTLVRDGVRRRQMRLEEFGALLEPAAPDLRWLALYGTRGEPLLHPQLEEAVALARRATTAKVVVSTNASLLTPERGQRLLEAGLSELILAIDGLSQASYERYRVNGDLATVIANARAFCEHRRSHGFGTRVVLQFIPMGTNEHELPDVAAFGRDLGVDEVRLKLSSSVAGSDAFRTSSPALRPRGPAIDDDAFDCPMGLDLLYVDPNGDCYPCCYGEGEPEMRLGNAFEQGLAAVWESPAAWELRRAFAEQDGFSPFCVRTCRGVARRTRVPLYQIASHHA